MKMRLATKAFILLLSLAVIKSEIEPVTTSQESSESSETSAGGEGCDQADQSCNNNNNSNNNKNNKQGKANGGGRSKSPNKGSSSDISGESSNIIGGISNAQGGISNEQGGSLNAQGGASNEQGGILNGHGTTPSISGQTSNVIGATVIGIGSTSSITGLASNVNGRTYYVTGPAGEGSGVSGQGLHVAGQGSGVAGQGPGVAGQGSGAAGQWSGGAGQGSGVAGQYPGVAGQGSGVAGQWSGGAGQGSGVAGQYPGVAGQGSGVAGQWSGGAGQGSGVAGQYPGVAGQYPGVAGQWPGAAGQGSGVAGQGWNIAGQAPGVAGQGVGVAEQALGIAGAIAEPAVNVIDTILQEVNASNIRDNLKFLSESPHLAGSIRDEQLIDFIEITWQEQGFDEVRRVSYNSLLSYPDRDHPNKVHLLDADGNITFSSRHQEDILRPEDEHPDFVHMFFAYAPNGTAEGNLVYAHYATAEDFDRLNELGISVKGHIVIAKYGAIYRGNKAYLAQKHGAIGLILFNDPSEAAQDGEDAEHVYPNSWWLQSSGAQRGSLWPSKGDPATPRYPSIDGSYQLPLDEIPLPKIPCQPIGYDDARQLLRLLDGPEAPEEWQGPLQSSVLRLGPNFVNTTDNAKVRIVVNNQLKNVNTTNVIGIIRGSSEPDRYVMAGNHRDAWGFGAVDASSGTAQMLEVTRVFGELLLKGWRPKRSIVFFSWGSEEYGLIGSTEYVEDNLVKLSDRGVAYINTDICSSGDLLKINAAPMLKHYVKNIVKLVPAPNNESESLYDSWTRHFERAVELGQESVNDLIDGEVRIGYLRGGTDHVPFAFIAGVNSIDLTFSPNLLNYNKTFSSYPAYHTGFDTFHYVDAFVDPGFALHQACGQLNGLLIQNLADADILPLNVTHYALSIREALDDLKTQGLYEKLINHSINIDRLDSELNDFQRTAEEWEAASRAVNLQDKLALRILNDQLIHLDQNFLLLDGLPLQRQLRHAVFALSLHNSYGSSAFPGIQDLLFEIDKAPDQKAAWTEVEKHVSDLIVAVHRATQFIQPVQVL